LAPEKYSSLEALGITVLDAGTETQIADLATLYKNLGKETFAICDKQDAAATTKIDASVKKLFMHDETGFEKLVMKNTTAVALLRFSNSLDWPLHLKQKFPDPSKALEASLNEYFVWSKGNLGIADFLVQCSEAEIPSWLRQVCIDLKAVCQPPRPSPTTKKA
jgi:putative ATP-dependent endonuclease of OLD family